MNFDLTALAQAKVKEALVKACKKFLRVKVVGGGCSGLQYAMDFSDQADENRDKIFKFPNDTDPEVQVLIDKKSFIYLAGTTLDYEESLMGGHFIFKNPKAKKSCGCGDSFSV